MKKDIYYDTIREASVKLSYSLPYENEGLRMEFTDFLEMKLKMIIEDVAKDRFTVAQLNDKGEKDE